MTLNEIKEMVKQKTYPELLELEIECNRKTRKPYAFGLETAKLHRAIKRQVVREQTRRKIQSWAKTEA